VSENIKNKVLTSLFNLSNYKSNNFFLTQKNYCVGIFNAIFTSSKNITVNYKVDTYI
jgi:hypothetical protein